MTGRLTCTILALATLVAASPAPAWAQELDYPIATFESFLVAFQGTSNLGPLSAAATQSAQVTGNTTLELVAPWPQAGELRLAGGGVSFVDEIVGTLTPPVPGPGAGTVEFRDVSFRLDSAPFPGTFSSFAADAVLTFTAGSVVVDPPSGNSVVQALAGTAITTSASGTHGISTPQSYLLQIVDIAFALEFDTPEWRGSIPIQGVLTSRRACPPPTVYCPTSPNSAGAGATLSTDGLQSIALNSLSLSVQAAPANRIGLFFFGDSQLTLPFGDGMRCVGGSLTRMPVRTTDAAGGATQVLDFRGAANTGGGATAGETLNLQFWYRDNGPGGTGFNLSDAVAVPLCP